MDGRRARRRAPAAGLGALALVLLVGVPVLRGDGVVESLVRAAVLLVVLTGVHVVLGRAAAQRARGGVLEGGARAEPGVHPEIDGRWHRVEIRPAPGTVDLRPLAGGTRSWRVARLDLAVTGEPRVVRTVGPREAWRIAPGLVVVAVPTARGDVELAVRRGDVDVLREGLRVAG